MLDAIGAESLSRDFFAARVRGDLPALEALLAPSFWLIEPLEGWKVSRSTFFHDAAGNVLEFRVLQPDSLLVRTYADNVAIVIGSVQMTGRIAENFFSLRCRFTHVFVRDAGRWQLVNAQETPLPAWDRVSEGAT